MAKEQKRALIVERMETEIPSAKQQAFFEATARHVLYGGARAGGKSWAMRRKFVLMAIHNHGMRLLLLRRTFPQLRENHILDMQAELKDFASYNDDQKAFTFPNGSRIKLGFCDSEADVYQYQGQEYDVIGFEEATQFTEFQITYILTCNRSKTYQPRAYYTANPGGPGHSYLKRLFIDRAYKGEEKPDDYQFIQATIFDNKVLMENDPGYVKVLETLPEEMRRAHLYGDWDVYVGQYFTEFQRGVHVLKPFEIPKEWRRYFTIDYGRDMLAGYWIAMDTFGRAYVYREVYQSGLNVSAAAGLIRAAEGSDVPDERFAPPDLYAKSNQTGRSVIEVMGDHGLWFTRTKNDRIPGWYDLAEWLSPYLDEQDQKVANLRIFDTCPNLIRCLPLAQRNERGDPNDISDQPHEISHSLDAVRYFVTGRPRPTQIERAHKRANWEPDMYEDYDNADEAGKRVLLDRWGNPF